MSSISSVGSSAAQYAGVSSHRRPDPSKMVEDIFSKLDTKGQGYLEKSDLESALSGLGSDSSASVDDVFSTLDGDGDGKVTKDEMSSSLQKLADELDSQFNASRMSAAQGGGMRPPPPAEGEEDEGYTQDELSAIASATDDSNLSELMNSLAANFDAADANGDGKVTQQEAMAYQESADAAGSGSATAAANGMPPPPPGGRGGDEGLTLDQVTSMASSTTDSKLSELLNTISSNFDAADANGDGKVTQQEAMAYQESTQTSSDSSSSSDSGSTSASNEAAVLKRIMDLVQSYGSGSGSNFSQLLSSISTSA